MGFVSFFARAGAWVLGVLGLDHVITKWIKDDDPPAATPVLAGVGQGLLSAVVVGAVVGAVLVIFRRKLR